MGVSLMRSIFKIDCLQQKRRLWILDRRIRFICSEHRDALGDWIHRKLQKGVIPQAEEADVVLKDCGVEELVLRKEWELQKESQLSLHARTLCSALFFLS